MSTVLKIYPETEAALRKFIEEVDAGHLTHTIDDGRVFVEHVTRRPVRADESQFNMQNWTSRHKCGTVHCVGGWTESYLERELTMAEETALHDLFYPGAIAGWSSITPQMAAQAVRNMLDLGKPLWAEIKGE